MATRVTPKLLRAIAGARFFSRGEAYFDAGAVRSLRADGGGVRAMVRGTHAYRVRLWVEGDGLGHDCTCPVGEDGEFCKHCVAVGLAWHAAGQGEGTAEEGGADDVRDFLMGLDKEALASMLLDRAGKDEALHRRLSIRAAHAKPAAVDLSVWKGAFDEALEAGGYRGHWDAYENIGGVEDVIESLEEMLRAGRADGVIELAEHGLETLEESLEYIDDSDGEIGGLLERLQDIHLEACQLARPDPVELAERLFELECESSFGTFHGAAIAYADILGESGLAAYRGMAEAAWARVPVLDPGDDDPSRYGARYRIESIMAGLARASGDLEDLVAVKSRDLSAPHDFLGIAQLYRDAGDADRALEWAERGWRAFPDTRHDEGLRAFLADAYQGRGRRDEAMALVWDAFAVYPHIEAYQELERHGRRAGGWPHWREKALALVRERIAGEKSESPISPSWIRAALDDRSLLVEVFLHERNPDAAWAEAEAGGCSRALWLALAKRRERSHPADSVRVYKDHVAALLRNTGNRVYEEAVGALAKIEALLARSGEDAQFRSYMSEVRATHRRKRKLIEMLDGKGW